MSDPAGHRARSDWPVRKRRLHDPEPDDVAHLTPAERMAMVWPLTLAAWAFKNDPDAPDRLPRHVIRLVRRGR
jgi:hypothetical protein